MQIEIEEAMDKLKVGHIPYLNCVPFFHYLKEAGFDGEMISGVPSALNQMLQLGQVDVSPSSSFEYARNWQDYLLLPNHSISSVGKVYSVLLFSPVPLAELSGTRIAITGDSATSINLLRIILREFVGLEQISDAVPERPVEEEIAAGQPALLIGDRALRLANSQPEGMQIFDLGEIWYHYTGLPFVFALWMVRRETLNRHAFSLQELGYQLRSSSERVLAHPEKIAAQHAALTGMTAEQIVDYWRTIDYRLEQPHREGLELFFSLCAKLNLLKEAPQINFLPRQIEAVAD